MPSLFYSFDYSGVDFLDALCPIPTRYIGRKHLLTIRAVTGVCFQSTGVFAVQVKFRNLPHGPEELVHSWSSINLHETQPQIIIPSTTPSPRVMYRSCHIPIGRHVLPSHLDIRVSFLSQDGNTSPDISRNLIGVTFEIQ
jgi:hypothetical protein